MAGKNMNYFLMDDTSNGRIKCTLANWTGVAFKIPRTDLDKCKGRSDLMQSGVYFLFGKTDLTDEDVVYIGQASVRKNGEGILFRLQEHRRNPDKDYWTEAVVFTTSNNSFGPTEISYLENRFTNLALKAKRYIVKNGNDPNPGNITEEKESEMEEFIAYSELVMGTLGFKIFEPLIEKQKPVIINNDIVIEKSEGLLLHLKRKGRKGGSAIEADCEQTSEGFVVLKGSHIELIDVDSIPPNIREARRKAKIDENGVLQEDVLFKSPSAAAGFVVGGSVSGNAEWKNADGKTLKEIENEETSVDIGGDINAAILG